MASARTVLALVFLAFTASAQAQPADDPRAETVTWTAQPLTAGKPGERLKLTLNGAVKPGWHVYALKQAPLGPTPLLAKLEQNDIAQADGAVSASPATKFHDPAFGFETQYYGSAFTLTLPVRLRSQLAADAQAIPVSVRFQTCSGRICQPPKTVRLSAPIKVGG